MTAPEWVYLNTWIEEDFEAGVPTDLFWTSHLRDSYGMITEPSDGDAILHTKTGAQTSFEAFNEKLIEGNFDLEYGLKISDAYDAAGNVYLAFSSELNYDLMSGGWYMGDGGIVVLNVIVPGMPNLIYGTTPSALREVKIKHKRVGSLITNYYDIGAGWVTAAKSGDDSDPVVSAMFVSDELTPGLSYLKFQADVGLPFLRFPDPFLLDLFPADHGIAAKAGVDN